MTKMQSEIKKTVEEIKRIDTEKKIGFIVLYGSIVNKRQGKRSDIDLTVYYAGNENERFRFRTKVLGRVSNKFDVQIFQDLPLYIKKDIITTGKTLYYRNYKLIFDEYLKTIRDYEDFEKYLEYYYSRLDAA